MHVRSLIKNSKFPLKFVIKHKKKCAGDLLIVEQYHLFQGCGQYFQNLVIKMTKPVYAGCFRIDICPELAETAGLEITIQGVDSSGAITGEEETLIILEDLIPKCSDMFYFLTIPLNHAVTFTTPYVRISFSEFKFASVKTHKKLASKKCKNKCWEVDACVVLC
jgi:hypothetical protein